MSEIVRAEPNICQLVVLKRGETVFSGEANGYRADDCVHVMSATKSVMAILLGIALDKGLVKSIDDEVLDYFPDYVVKRGEKTIQSVTIRHLITMRAPYKCRCDPWKKVCTSADWTKTSLDFLGGRKGLTDEFNYQTVCLHILSGLLFRATGLTTVDFANKYLFTPLGIPPHVNFYAKSAEEHRRFILEKMPKPNVWFADQTNLATPGYGLCLSATDLAKIGQLCLGRGMFRGRRVVSADWIAAMTTPRKVEGKMFRGMDYGFLWWIIHPGTGVYAAIGNSGNVIYVNPARRIVVGITASFKPTVFDRVDFIENVILPATAFTANK